MNLWVLSGIAVMVGGFVWRLNPLVVVAGAALATGLAAGMDPLAILAAFGKAFNDTRYVSVIWIVLPVIGLMERHGLQERARALVAGMKGATLPRLLTGYLLLRQITAALGLTSIAGPAQTVRPLLAPMAEVAAAPRDQAEANKVKALAAATDNVGLFFGEDIFIAIGSILLMKGFLEQQGIELAPFDLSVWAIPTALAAFAIHSLRLWLFARRRG
ncbi:MAG: DUF969 domain-containing protein [Novosphingobium sp.]|uniref:DUF969 domain-containing protein n=1 Tax=Novosphingobium sp. TaxID=1874826 RepID=UPI001E14D8D5|nr:DUF969 domain-containing protein [Novosphingobium sp.]MCB2057309.1 DUF969 domain-containing protein [Novosphingobium sp.]MCP5385699.1 DUF969 domain-containing protein [Novosphingobium sp.]